MDPEYIKWRDSFIPTACKIASHGLGIASHKALLVGSDISWAWDRAFLAAMDQLVAEAQKKPELTRDPVCNAA